MSDADTELQTIIEVKPQLTDKPKLDYYELLNVNRSATKDEILAAYEVLAIKYQSKDAAQEVSEETLQNINKAFFILSDDNKRKHYDSTGEDPPASPQTENNEDHESMDVANLGGIGRVFGAMISRLGVPIPTQVSHDIITIASEMCR